MLQSYQNSPPQSETFAMEGVTTAPFDETVDETDRGISVLQRYSSHSRNSTRGRSSRTYRGSVVLSALRKAFSINQSYSIPNSALDDSSVDGDGNDEEELVADDPTSRRWLVCGFVVFSVLAFASLTVKRQRSIITPANGSSSSSIIDEAPDICKDDSAVVASSFVGALEHAAVATDQAICSDMATKIMMASGGNAVDAAITAALCLGVANPSSSGLGGGAFMLIHAVPTAISRDDLPDFIDARTDGSKFNTASDADGSRITDVIDCRETAPAAAFTEMYDNLPTNASVLGGLAIPVFSELKCLELAHKKFGSLPWKALVKPVVELAGQGVPITPYLAHVLLDTAGQHSKNTLEFGLRKLLTRNDNWKTVLTEGQLLKNYALTETLKALQEQGAEAFYETRAQTLAKEIQDAGGVVTSQDLKSYRATIRSPISTSVHGFRLFGLPPPSSGGAAVLGVAQFLSTFSTPLVTFASTLSQHRIVEAFKHVFAIRMSLSDPDYNTEVCQEAVRDLTTPDFMARLRQAAYLDNTTLPLSNYGGAKWAQLNDTDAVGNSTDAKEGDRRSRRKLLRPFGYLEDSGTSHFSVVDSSRNAVAMTTSINTVFGSAVVSPSTGIIFGNTMDDFGKPDQANHFGLRPSEANFVKPGKRPLSSMSPMLVFQESTNASLTFPGQLILALGASGGPKIITAVTQVFLNHVIMGLPLLQSVVQPRLHDQLIYHNAAVTNTENVQLDSVSFDISQRTRDALTTRGHSLLDVDYMGTVQAISIDTETGKLSAACDPRKGGSPAGY